MNNYKSFAELKEELGSNYDFKLYEMGISALKEVEKLQQENKQLKEKLDCDLQWAFKYEKQVDNWDKLKEWVNKHYDYYINNEDYIGGRLCFNDMKNIMQELELEQGSDSNE